MRKQFFVLLIAVLLTAGAKADDPPCKTNTPECIDRFASDWLKAEMGKTNTGVSNLASPSQSTTKDFLSTLAGALLVPMSGNGSRPLSIDYNLPLTLAGEQRVKLQTVLAKPELSGDMKQRLDGKPAGLTAENDSLSELDDVTVSAALDPSNVRLGRSLGPHEVAYKRMLAAHLGESVTADGVNEFAKPFAKLLNNQPQFFGSVLYHARKNVAGPDERSARLTYEMGFGNLNGFYRSKPSCVDLTPANAASCANDLVAFAGGAKATADDPANRVVMSVEYRASDALSVVLPRYAIHYRAPKGHTFVYSLAYGRNSMGARNGRIDFNVDYEDTRTSVATDILPTGASAAIAPPKDVRDRLVAAVTYTYKINGMMAMPLSIAYANHSEYLGDVGRKLNAHIGITVKMPGTK